MSNSAVTAIILAAGTSRRMGDSNKLLAPWKGKDLLLHAVETALASTVDETIVVIGYQSGKVRQALNGVDVRFIENSDYEDGLSTSLKAGIGAVNPDHQGAAVLLGDMPQLEVETLDDLLLHFKDASAASICLPVCASMRGNPVLWPRRFFMDIMNLSGDKGARELVKRNENSVLEVICQDFGVLNDVDVPSDLD